MTIEQYIIGTLIWLVFAIIAFLSSLWRFIDNVNNHTFAEHSESIGIMKYVFDMHLPSSIVRFLTVIYFIGQGYFQLTFPPMQPHFANNLYRTLGTTILMIIIIVGNIADLKINSRTRTELPIRYLKDVDKTARLLISKRHPRQTHADISRQD